MPHRILIADDSQCLRELMETILSACGYRVTIAEDGQAAWEELTHCQPDLVLLDIEMPRIDGCEVCRRIKSQPETRNIPVILISGRRDAADLARCVGADAFLSKPFSVDDLRGRIGSLLCGTLNYAAN
jgi:CheY-like chemotaxis protein